MQIRTITANSVEYPDCLRRLDLPPKQLYVIGCDLRELMARPRIAIVGSRSVTRYGRQVTHTLAKDLASRGVVVISGLAIGVDGIAHRAALEAGGTTVAVLPSPLTAIAPSSHVRLAKQIVERGGTVVSEYHPGEPAYKQNFIARNRIVAGLAHSVLITEATQKSGTLHTARYTLEQGKDVLAVPGNITSPGSIGTNNLIKRGATPITSYVDVLAQLGLKDLVAGPQTVRGGSAHQQAIIDLLARGEQDGQRLLELSGLTAPAYNQALTMLELADKVRPLGGNAWTLS